MLTEIHIDPNVRVAGNQTFSGFEDVKGGAIPVEGEQVLVREPEANLTGLAEVRRVDHHDRLIYLAVDWKTLVPARLPTSSELQSFPTPPAKSTVAPRPTA